MDYTEVEFLLAATGVGSAQAHYEATITPSFEDFGRTGAASYIATFGAYSEAKLAKQFQIAIYNKGFEGWSIYKMYAIHITFAQSADRGNPIPNRFTYPVNEQT